MEQLSGQLRDWRRQKSLETYYCTLKTWFGSLKTRWAESESKKRVRKATKQKPCTAKLHGARLQTVRINMTATREGRSSHAANLHWAWALPYNNFCQSKIDTKLLDISLRYLKLFNIPIHFFIFRTYKQTHRMCMGPLWQFKIRKKFRLCT